MMQRFFRLFARVRGTTANEWKLLTEALAAIAVARAGLKVQPLRQLNSGICNRLTPTNKSGADPAAIILAIHRASRLLPGTVCLPKALAAQWMLYRRGHASTIHIGVNRTPERGLESHAWITHKQTVLLGGTASPTIYRDMLQLESSPLF